MDKQEITVLAEQGQEVLIRIDGAREIGGQIYRTRRHEWWYDRGMMEQGIHSDEHGHIYCRGFAGSKDEEVLEIFKNGGWR